MNKNDPVSFVRWIAQSTHQKYHDGKWEKCQEATCVAAKQWIKDFKKDDKVWVTADKRVILIRELEDAHLYNAHNYMKKKVSAAFTMTKRTGVDVKISDIEAEFPVINDLKAEIIRRKAAKIEVYGGTRDLDL